MNPDLIKKRIQDLVAEQAELDDAAAAENRDLSDAERVTYEGLEAQINVAKSQLSRAQARAKAHAEAEAASVTAGRRSVPNAVAGGIEVGEEVAQSAPNHGFSNARQFFLAVMESSRRQELTHPGLRYLTAGSDEQSSVSDPYGGFLVPEAFMPDLLTIGVEMDPTAGTRNIPMAAPIVKIPARVDTDHSSSVTGGFTVYRRAETDTITASRGEISQVVLDAKPLMGVSYATEELISDSAVSFAALIEQAYRDEFLAKRIREKIAGTGAGEYLGVLNSPAAISVAKETGQTADTIVWENIIKMRSRCWGYNNAVWLYNHDALPQLMQLSMPIGTAGVAMWNTSGVSDRPDTLCGRPAYATEYCETVGDAGDIILVNWTQYLEGIYQPLQGDESMHVRFVNNERTFRFTMRCDAAPWWKLYLTPQNSTTTLSPIVTLAARA
jgi:HK97 family phage major capsid protein